MRLPTTREEILATSTIDAEFAAAIKANPLPSFSGLKIEQLEAYVESALPKDQATLAASRPADIDETSHNLTLKDGHCLRIVIAKFTTPSPNGSPIIILYHGGGHCIGSPEMEVHLARELVKAFSAIFVLPSYRLAPEHTTPQSFLDGWEILRWIAKESSSGISAILSTANPKLGFIIGGTSAGGNMVCSLAHLARDQKLTPR
jgi:acetyl esterase/lipase